MAGLKRKYNKWEAHIRIPKPLQSQYEGRAFLYRTLATSDRRAAKAEADHWEAVLRIEWAEKLGHDSSSLSAIRATYQRDRQRAAGGEFIAYGGWRAEGEDDPVLLGIGFEIDRLAEAAGDSDLTPLQSARLAALQDAAQDVQGLPVSPRREMEPSFSELADEYLSWWKAQHGLKETNTEQQKRATFRLFTGHWNDRAIRGVRKVDAARFMDALRRLSPDWGRSPAAKGMTWTQLQRSYGGRDKGLSDASVNRHADTLQALWEWGAERDYCEGRNPFNGFRKRLQSGRNVKGYLPWQTDELRHLFSPPPKRRDLAEIMLVGLLTGLRLDEIAAMRWDQLRVTEGIAYVQVVDAKTPAGNRQVPLHADLRWLADRAASISEEDKSSRVWATFNPEGPGRKPGADAGREFSRFKQSKGYGDRQKTFHSFRKNVVGQLEAKGVPESEVAQIVGHEKSFTFGRYGQGIPLARKAEIVALIAYPGLTLPHPSS